MRRGAWRSCVENRGPDPAAPAQVDRSGLIALHPEPDSHDNPGVWVRNGFGRGPEATHVFHSRVITLRRL